MSNTAVVILNYNGAHFLDQFLPTLIAYTYNCDLIVADNKSTDNSLEILKKFADRIRVIELEENFGYAGGYNQALKDLPNEFIILLNSDVEVTDDWTYPLISLLEKEGEVAAAQPKIKDFNNKDRFEYAGAAGGYIDKLGYPFCRGRIFNTLEKDVGQYEDPTQIFWATGACFIIRAKVFKDIGGFDNSFFAHMEEIDLCWRLNNRGYQIKYQPKSTVYHVGGGTLNKQSPKKTFLNIRNNLLTLYKNLPASSLMPILFLRVFLDLAAATLLGVKLGSKHGAAVIKAWIAFIKHKKEKDSFNRHNKKYFTKSIVSEYYLRGKRTFDEL